MGFWGFGKKKAVENIFEDTVTASNGKLSCISDAPIKSKMGGDSLHAGSYADALCRFILDAGTPVTIGIQGGWGSGKTSLITLLGDKLDNRVPLRALTVFVNAWEHSLFQHTENKAEVALSILEGLREGIRESVTSAQKNDKIASDICDAVLEKEKALQVIMSNLRDSLPAMATFAANLMLSHVNMSVPTVPASAKPAEAPRKSVSKNVHELQVGLRGMIERLTSTGTPDRVVFFIDDLDRVPPATAVEILDILKNVFNIPKCVFVLAIDYDVVVKGLRDKFGEKTIENEREFRQYFDKIIQIPFNMPIGAYRRYMSTMLDELLKELGFIDQQEGQQIDEKEKQRINERDKQLEDLASILSLATKGVPRSIKRILNTMSLLRYIASENSGRDDESAVDMLEVQCIVVSLYINFHEICHCVMEYNDFLKWNFAELESRWDLKKEDNANALAKVRGNEEFDEEWEQVLFCVCAKSPWLRSRATDISKLMNRLRQALKPTSNSEIGQEGLEALNKILPTIAVVSVDSGTGGTSQLNNSSLQGDACTQFCQNIHRSLEGFISGMAKCDGKQYAEEQEDGGRIYFVDIEDNDIVDDFYILWQPENGEQCESLYLCFTLFLPQRGKIGAFRKKLKEFETDKILIDGEECYLAYEFKSADFDGKVDNYVKDAVDLYKSIMKEFKSSY